MKKVKKSKGQYFFKRLDDSYGKKLKKLKWQPKG
jgi:hypothetical protein